LCAYARTGRQRSVLVLPTKGKLAVQLVYTILYVPDVSATLLIAYYADSTRANSLFGQKNITQLVETSN
jgi:hypothetical protein